MEKLEKQIKVGYDKLLTSESEDGGFEWFGKNPGRVALSAFGLQQFNEISKVLDLGQQKVIDRTVAWILENSQDGLFNDSKGEEKIIVTNPIIKTAYVLWTLTSLSSSLSYQEYKKSFDIVEEFVTKTQDPYTNGLFALSLSNVGNFEEAFKQAKNIAKNQRDSGEVIGPNDLSLASITNSKSRPFLIESTAMSAITWLQVEPEYFKDNIDLALEYITSNMVAPGLIYQTQAACLSFKALILYSQQFDSPKGKRDIALYYNGALIESLSFDSITFGEGSLTNFDFS